MSSHVNKSDLDALLAPENLFCVCFMNKIVKSWPSFCIGKSHSLILLLL